MLLNIAVCVSSVDDVPSRWNLIPANSKHRFVYSFTKHTDNTVLRGTQCFPSKLISNTSIFNPSTNNDVKYIDADTFTKEINESSEIYQYSPSHIIQTPNKLNGTILYVEHYKPSELLYPNEKYLLIFKQLMNTEVDIITRRFLKSQCLSGIKNIESAITYFM